MLYKSSTVNVKQVSAVLTAMLFLIAVAGVERSLAGENDRDSLSRQQSFPEITKGQYLAIAGNCATCHTTEGGMLYAGGVAFVTDFGTLYSTNISQDPETGIGKWTEKDFIAAMREGVRPDGTHLYPAFPYTAFAMMTDDDLSALYRFLQTVPAVKAPARETELEFPYSLRPLLAIWKLLFHEAKVFETDETQSAEWNRGRYLVEGLGHCGSCHTPRNFLGAEQRELALSGAVYFDKVPGGEYRKWTAVNLTPSKPGLGAWSKDHLYSYLKTGLSERATVYGPMNEVVMNSTSHLTERDVRAMANYLNTLPEISPEQESTPYAESVAAGAVVYDVYCGTCHLPTGKGAPPGTIEPGSYGVPVAGSAVVQAADPSSLINTILFGPQIPGRPFTSHRKMMEPLGDDLSNTDVANLSNFLRASWGNSGGLVMPEQVAEQR